MDLLTTQKGLIMWCHILSGFLAIIVIPVAALIVLGSIGAMGWLCGKIWEVVCPLIDRILSYSVQYRIAKIAKVIGWGIVMLIASFFVIVILYGMYEEIYILIC